MADKFQIPILMLVDTPGAYPGIGAEERNQSEAIARNLYEFADLTTPTVSVVIGEGGSGGALAISVADKLAMMRYSVYAVISPEGCSAILWNDPAKVETAANALKITAENLKDLNLIDDIINEPLIGAHRKKEEAILEQMQKRRRRYIRNGDSELRIVSGAAYQDAFLDMHRKTFKNKKNQYPYSKAFLDQLMQVSTKQQAAKFWAITTLDGSLVAALWVVFDHATMYQLLSAYNEESSHHAAMSLLTWHAITEAQKMGLTTFDFEGSIHPGIEPFFRKFGGERVSFLAFEQYHSFLWQCKKFLLG
jgi:hypothetical protein